MAFLTSIVIPTAEMTLTAQKKMREGAGLAGMRRAVAVGAVSSIDDCLAREMDNVVDFGCGVGGQLTMPLLAAGAIYSVFATAVPAALTPQLANNRLAVFYKINIETAPTPVDQISFREGVGAGTTYAVMDLEGLATKLECDGYFSEPIIYDPQRVLNIVVRCRIATLAQARVRLGCYIIEPKGPVVSPGG